MARRVNTKFLIIFSVIVVGGVVALFVGAPALKNYFRGDRSKKLIEAGDLAMKEATAPGATAQVKRDKLEEAARKYTQAAGTETKNAELQVKLGDALNKLTQFDLYSYIRGARAAWDRALEIDPGYLPALKRLEETYNLESQLNPQANIFSLVEDKAQRIHKLEPGNLKSHSLMYIAPLNQWLANIETPTNKIDDSITELSSLISQNPTSPEIADMVFFMATAKAKRGAELRRSNQEAAGNDLLKQAMQAFYDAVKNNEKNANLHYRFYELLRIMQVEDAERDNTQHYKDTAKAELEKARTLISKDDPNYVKINIAAQEYASSQKDPKKAEQILLDLRNNKPDDQRVRLSLARLWKADPAKQLEAIKILEQPIIDSGFEGVEALRRRDLENQTYLELGNMYVERFSTVKEADRPAALKEIEAVYDKVASRGENSAVLKLKGKLELLRGGSDAPIRAIQTFEKAQAQKRIESNGREDLDLTFLLARTYYATRMSGQAKQQLEKMKERVPDFIPARLMLAQLKVAENDRTGARDDVFYLYKQAPDDPEVVRLYIAVLDPEKEAAALKENFDKLKEGDRASRMSKAAIAASYPVQNTDEAIRLYKLVLADDPADFEALQGAKELLVSKNRKTEAMDILRAGQKAKPDDRRIGLLMRVLDGATEDEVRKASLDLIVESFAEPFARELKLYEFENVSGRKEEALKHLQAAEKIKPDDGRVQDYFFQLHLSQQEWDKASYYADKLSEKNWDQANGLIYKYRLAMTQGKTDVGLNIAREMTVKLPEFARSWVFLAQAYQSTGQYDNAVSNYTVALDKQSENADAIAGVIACYFQLNRPNDAATYIDRGMKAHPNNKYFKDQWNAYMLNSDPAKIVAGFVKERDANPNDVNRWVNLGRAQYAAARKRTDTSAKFLADAKATFMETVQRFPGEKIGWAYLAEIADFARDYDGGIAMLNQMIARPEFKDAPEPTLMLADHYLRFDSKERPTQALVESTMKQALEKFKDNLEVRRRFAAYYTQQKRYADALKLLDPSSPDKLVRQQIVEIMMLSGDFAGAEKLLRGLLSTNPKDGQLHALLGVVLLNQNKSEQALESMTAALEIDPKNQAALYSRGQLRLAAKPPQVDEAIKDFVALRDVNGNHVEARVSLAEAFRQKQQIDSAERELEEALRRAPGRRDIRINLAGLYASSKPPAWADAERVITEIEAVEPTQPVWKRMLAKMYSTRGLHDKAATKIREAMQIDSKNGDLIKDYFDILEAGKNFSQLLIESDTLLKADKNMAEKGWWVYLKRAVARRNRDMKNEAMQDFEKALDIVQKSEDASSQDILIGIIDRIGDNMGLPAAIDRATKLAVGNGATAVRWKVVLAYLYYRDNNTKRAIEMIEEARSMADVLDDRNQAATLNVAGTIYMANQEYDKGRTAYEKLLEKRPEDLAALNNLACIVAEHATPPDVKKALEYSGRAIDVMRKKLQEDANVYDTHGWMNVLAGGANLDKGIELLNTSIKVGEIPEAHYHLGEAFMQKKFYTEAKRSFTRAAEMLLERKEKGQFVDDNLKQKIESGLTRVEKELLRGGGNP